MLFTSLSVTLSSPYFHYLVWIIRDLGQFLKRLHRNEKHSSYLSFTQLLTRSVHSMKKWDLNITNITGVCEIFSLTYLSVRLDLDYRNCRNLWHSMFFQNYSCQYILKYTVSISSYHCSSLNSSGFGKLLEMSSLQREAQFIIKDK